MDMERLRSTLQGIIHNQVHVRRHKRIHLQRVVKLKQYDENVYFNKVSAAVEQWNSQPAVSFSIFLTFNEEASEAQLNKTPTSCR